MPKPVVRLTVDLSPRFATAIQLLVGINGPDEKCTKRSVLEGAILTAMHKNGYQGCEACGAWVLLNTSAWQDSEGVVLCPKCAEEEDHPARFAVVPGSTALKCSESE